MLTTFMAIAFVVSSQGAGARPLANPAFLADVGSVSSDFKDSADLLVAVQPQLAVPSERVPKPVFDATAEWVKIILRPAFAETLLASRWTGYANDTHFDEYLVAKARVGDVDLTWSDTGQVVAVLLDLGGRTELEDAKGVEKFVMGTLEKFFSLRETPGGSVRCLVKKQDSTSGRIWGGYVPRGIREKAGRAPSGGFTTPIRWDCQMLVITDGRYVLVRTVLHDEDHMPKAVSASSRVRGYRPPKSRFDESAVPGSPVRGYKTGFPATD